MTMPTGFFVASATGEGEGLACAAFIFACATFGAALRAPLPPAAAATPLSGRTDSAHASSTHASAARRANERARRSGLKERGKLKRRIGGLGAFIFSPHEFLNEGARLRPTRRGIRPRE